MTGKPKRMICIKRKHLKSSKKIKLNIKSVSTLVWLIFERTFQDFPEQMFHTSVLMAKIPGTLDSLGGGCVSVVLLELIFIS